MKPSFTLTYGLGYQLEMPPYELNGKQIELTDASGKPIQFSNYFAQRESAALQGQVYNPTIAYTNIGNVTGASKKYPYNPFYGGLSPRVSAAWNPHFTDGILGKLLGNGKTVIRGGYGRIYGRLNGVDLVLIPLLGTGLRPAHLVPRRHQQRPVPRQWRGYANHRFQYWNGWLECSPSRGYANVERTVRGSSTKPV